MGSPTHLLLKVRRASASRVALAFLHLHHSLKSQLRKDCVRGKGKALAPRESEANVKELKLELERREAKERVGNDSAGSQSGSDWSRHGWIIEI